MKLKTSFFYTLREDAKDEETTSGNLLVKSGMVKKTMAGVYTYMPLGLKAKQNVEKIIKEEMNRAGAQEVLMPSLLPSEVYEASGRKENFGDDMFSLEDRYGRECVLGPTHEEMFVNAATMKVKSYKDLGFTIYQCAEKFRDEPRPRFGLIRVRQFTMKDAYSFDKDDESCEISYRKMYDAYKRIYDRLGIDYKIVTADTGVMGGELSEEFQAVTDIGEDILVLCNSCEYASNIEVSKCVAKKQEKVELLEKEEVHTPNARTIEEVATFLNEKAENIVKTLIYKVDGKYYACLIAGDRELNETKLQKALNAQEVELALPEEDEKITGANVGFAGPIGLENVSIIVDEDVNNMYNFVVGANKTDYHIKNVNIKDFKVDYVFDIKNIKEGDTCPHCGGKVYFKKGIEIGNTFKLGDKYSKKMGLTFLDENNKMKYVKMGCYGIGSGRVLASIIEQNNDEKGMILPYNVAPFKVGIVLINSKNEEAVKYADKLYEELNSIGVDTLLDDRDERAGVKFNDMDLIGLPIRITIGKKFDEGMLELKLRTDEEAENIEIENVVSKIKKLHEKMYN